VPFGKKPPKAWAEEFRTNLSLMRWADGSVKMLYT
jgi:hypothetical protein